MSHTNRMRQRMARERGVAQGVGNQHGTLSAVRKRTALANQMAQRLAASAADIEWNDPEAAAKRAAEVQAQIDKEARQAFNKMLRGDRDQEETNE